MLWDEKKLKQLPQKKGFRLRGMNMTRLETFSDAAFAFATTMLIISIGAIPGSYQELLMALKGIPAFAAGFASITFLWAGHYKWSQRYGLDDLPSILISLMFLFIMLVYVYPLKIIFSALFAWISNGWLSTTFVIESREELANLFIIYGLGYASLMLMFVLLYNRAITLSNQLSLNPLEKVKTRSEISSFIVHAFTGFTSAAFAWIMPPGIGIFAGFVYAILPVVMPLVGIHYSKKIRRLNAG